MIAEPFDERGHFLVGPHPGGPPLEAVEHGAGTQIGIGRTKRVSFQADFLPTAQGIGELHAPAITALRSRDQPQRLRDLDRGQADAGRFIHGLEHVVGELADFRRHLHDRLRHQPQLLVRQDDDLSDGHNRRFKGLICRGQSEAAPVNPALTMIFRPVLTMKIYI